MRENMGKQEYALGNTDAEDARLIRQAAGLAPVTERLFREAGIAEGHRVLDLGSGVGDVAMLAARLVGATGEVVGVERDTRSITIARKRAGEAGLHHVRFLQADAREVESTQPFDAVVGRFILQFLPDPSGVLRSLADLLRPGGVVAFHEPSWPPFLLLSAHVPLWSAAGAIIYETFLKSGVSADMGTKLHRVFKEAGMPTPTISWRCCSAMMWNIRAGCRICCPA